MTTTTIAWTTVGEHAIALVNGFPVEVCPRCGGRGYLPGYEFSDGARCWGCMTARYTNTNATSDAVERLAARRRDGETVTAEDVDAERQRAITEYVKVLDRRAKARARRAAKAREKADARVAEQERARKALDVVFDRFPAAVDLTYYRNMLAAGADAYAIRGYEFAADRYQAGWDLSDRVLEIASDVTAKLVGVSTVPALTGGRQVVEGVVRSVKMVESYFGYRETVTWKMTVELDGGQRVYGTVPAALMDALTGGVISGGDVPLSEQLKGWRVRFTATVEVSDDDPAFGFASRPAKAALVGAPALEEVSS